MGNGASSSYRSPSSEQNGKTTYTEQTSMLVIPYSVFKKSGCIPRSDMNVAVPYSSIANRRKSFIVFVSHRWLQGHLNPAHPDKDNKKFGLICEVFDKMTKGLSDDIEVYIWIDFACINQDDVALKIKGVNSLPAYIERCDALLTPYTDATFDPPPSDNQVYDNPFNELWVNRWTENYQSLAEYCGRAWCRLEMFVGSNAPLISDGFDYFRRLGLSRKDRPHFVYGDHQQKQETEAEVLPKLSKRWYERVNPVQGALTEQSDLASIENVVQMVKVEVRNQDTGEYEGEENHLGQRHGKGTYSYESGGVYTGEWRNDKRHGQGTMDEEDGACYVGEWKDGKVQGNGRYAYADGNVYEGWFEDEKRHGHGVMTYRSTDRYEGDWFEGRKQGRGIFTSASGSKYEGGWRNDAYEGRGIYTYSSGARYIGMWKNGVKHGHGVYYFKGDSDVPRREGHFDFGQEHGDFLEWKSNGKTMLVVFKKGQQISEKEYKDHENGAARKIQRQTRKRQQKHHKAAAKIQAQARGNATRKKIGKKKTSKKRT